MTTISRRRHLRDHLILGRNPVSHDLIITRHAARMRERQSDGRISGRVVDGCGAAK
ncbi:hypothetical protein [Acrocarpospora phusangensis]|uniref:hypothetical protein n=1 Tax=Acrocarpospora phusangensis TaxID=1070424 RepID=UPI0019526379|nr:hypothetical protein [Acrocarpospora phusangensis]